MELELAGKAILKNLNVRRENHGEETKLGVDLKLVLSTDLNALACFSPTLRAFLYKEKREEKPLLKEPHLCPLRFDHKAENHMLTIGQQHTHNNVTINDFEIVPEELGAIEITMKVSMSDVPPDILPELADFLLAQVIEIDIEPMQESLLK